MEKQLPAIYDEPAVQEYMQLLFDHNKKKEYHDIKELLDYISQMDEHIESMSNELRDLKDKIEQLKNPEMKSQLKRISEKVETSVVSCKMKLDHIKINLISSMKKSVSDFKQKGKDAAIKVIDISHVKEGLSSFQKYLSFSKGAVLSLSWKIDDMTKELTSAKTALKNAGRIFLGKPVLDNADKNKLNFMQKSILKIENGIEKMIQKTDQVINKINLLGKNSVKNDIKMLKESSKSQGHQHHKKEQSR